MTDDLKLVERLRALPHRSTDEWISAHQVNIEKGLSDAASAIERLVRDRDRLAKLVAEMREVLSDATEALATKLTAEDRATKLRPPYEHPVSALDRARALLTTTEPTPDAALRAIHEQQGG